MKNRALFSHLIGGLLIASVCLVSTAHANSTEQQQFIAQMVSKYNFKKPALEQLFHKATVNPRVIKLMNTPYEAKPWFQYRTHFLSQKRVDGGVKFWHRYRKELNKVSRETGVPQNIIVAIIGVESQYGKHRGTFSAFDVLYTLSFNYPRRATFFKKELREFLILCREQGWNPLSIKGSYAAALGQPQFMPSSYRAYAKAYHHTNLVNLFDDEPDVIASVANYFSAAGWQRNKPIAAPAILKGKAYQKLPIQNRNTKISKPSLSLKKLSGYGVTSNTLYPITEKATFMNFDLEKGQSHWLGFTNFYVITRYNTSKLYALAVYQLAEKIQHSYHKKHH